MYSILNDLEIFSDSTQRPSYLFVCHQLRDEYSDTLFNSNLLKLDSYNGNANSWSEVLDRRSKRDIFLHSQFADIMVASFNTPLGVLEFMGSAKRSCEKLYVERGGNVATGILTVSTKKGGLRRWQWSMASV